MNRRLAAAFVAPLLLLAGCTAAADDGGPPQAESPFADCVGLTVPPASPAGASPAVVASPGVRHLPDLGLDCFTGGEPVSLRTLSGPAVINLWASWCGPCRKELPAFQRLHERMAGQVHVVGVNTADGRAAAISVGEDFGITFPNLVDPDTRLQRAVPPSVLPMTLLVDAQGHIRHQDVSGALDDARLADLVRHHLDLDVPA